LRVLSVGSSVPLRLFFQGDRMRKKGSIAKSRRIPAGDLRETLKEIHEKLTAAGVPNKSLPGNDLLIGQLPGWFDDEKIDEWVKKYAELVAKK